MGPAVTGMRRRWAALQHAARVARVVWQAERAKPRLSVTQAAWRALTGQDGYIVATIAIVTVLAAAASAYAQYEQGQAQQQAARYNAKIAEQQAQSAAQMAKAQADQQREQYRRQIATNRAATGAAGVSDVGSPLLLEADNATQAELNARMTEYGGQIRAQGFRSEIPLLRFQGRQAAAAGTIGAGATLLSGVASAGVGYYGATQRAPRIGTSSTGAWSVGSGGYY